MTYDKNITNRKNRLLQLYILNNTESKLEANLQLRRVLYRSVKCVN